MERLKITNWQGRSIDAPGRIPAEFTVGEETLSVKCSDPVYSIGILTGRYEIKNRNALYSFSTSVNIESVRGKAYAVVIQYDGEGGQIAGDYLTPSEDGIYSLSLELAEKCEYIEIELTFYSFGEGEVRFSNPLITAEEKRKHRVVNIATAYFERKWYKEPEKNIETVLEIMEKAAADENKPDIICFTETTYDRGTVNTEKTKWISADSEPVKRVCRKAKETGMYVIFSIHELDGKRKYNTALIISNEGEIVGKYRKTHLTYAEVEDGINPGPELPVFELPFGKIGIMICWDQWFPGVASTLFKKGAEIVFVPTAGNPVPIYCSRAYENGGYLVVSGCYDNMPSASCVVSQKGEIIAAVDDVEKGYAVASIDLDEHKHVDWLSFTSGYGANLYPIDLRRDFIIKEEQI